MFPLNDYHCVTFVNNRESPNGYKLYMRSEHETGSSLGMIIISRSMKIDLPQLTDQSQDNLKTVLLS